MTKQLVAFDLDGTLAESKQSIDPEMGDLLARLGTIAKIAVISGGDWAQFEQQLVGQLPAGIDLGGWFLLPTSGAKLYRHREAGWYQVYDQPFSDEERKHILAALDAAIVAAALTGDHLWGERVEDRGSQITFSGLGQHAPIEAKAAWDPDFAKRKQLQAILIPQLPGFAVRVGGSTSIDITREGIDKAYGMRQLSKVSGIGFERMIFLGDALYPGGNDEPVRAAGIDSIAVRDIHETKRVIETLLYCLAAPR